VELEQNLPLTPTTLSPFVANQELSAPTDQVIVNGQTLSIPEHAKPYPIVLITPSAADTKPIDYITLSDEHPHTDSSRERKRNPDYRVVETKDQRAISDEAVRRLQELLQNIFEAQDQSQEDTSSISLAGAVQYFMNCLPWRPLFMLK
jgi:hypothetical protein